MISDESGQAIIEALKETNRMIYPFIVESHELSYQYEENEDLIRMIENEQDH